MKYTILGFNQELLIQYGLDCIDALILRYIVDFSNTDRMMRVQANEKTYFWLKYEKLLADIPIAKINSKDVLRRRLKKMVTANILEHYTHREQGTYSYYRINPNKYEPLVRRIARGATEKSEGYDPEVAGVTTEKSEQIDKSTKDNPSTKDTVIPPPSLSSSRKESSSADESNTAPQTCNVNCPTPAPEKTPDRKGKATWLTPYDDIYNAVLGGHINFGQAGKAFKQVVAVFGEEATLAGWKEHCEKEQKYASPTHFASKPVVWMPKQKSINFVDTSVPIT